MKYYIAIFFVVLFAFGAPCFSLAGMSSQNFSIQADAIDVGGTRSSSGGVSLNDSLDELATGESRSLSFMADIGFWPMVGDEEVISFTVTDAVADLGTLDHSNVRYDTAAFRAATTAVSGYSIQFFGSPLTSPSHTINALSSRTSSSTDTEQFGFNLVANNSPVVGADPAGGSGQPATDYGYQNQFKFVSGETIAQSTIPSNFTNYTMSIISNITGVTDAGNYATNLTVVVTGRY
jgi:hypothetical protein